MKRSLLPTCAAIVVLGLAVVPTRGQDSPAPNTRIREWERGVLVESVDKPEMKMYLWFYEWHMFDAVQPGQHTRGNWTNQTKLARDGRSASVNSGNEGITLEVQAAKDGADLILRVTNRSEHDWPELATLVACFNPGPTETRNQQFANTKTWFPGPDGLVPLKMQYPREIHYNHALRESIDRAADDGKFVWSDKWPTSKVDAFGGLIIREATDANWSTGIAWDRYLSCQGHNPWECMHLGVHVGPLKQGASRQIRGRIYLLPARKESVLKTYRRDFEQAN